MASPVEGGMTDEASSIDENVNGRVHSGLLDDASLMSVRALVNYGARSIRQSSHAVLDRYVSCSAKSRRRMQSGNVKTAERTNQEEILQGVTQKLGPFSSVPTVRWGYVCLDAETG